MKPLGDIELKQALVGDYSRNAQRMGVSPDMGAIETQVLKDLNMVDAYESEQAAVPMPAKPDATRQRDIKTDELDAELSKHGMRAYCKDTPTERKPDMICDATPKSEKAVRMFGRIKQILRPRGNIAAVAQRGGSLRDSTVECTDPELAKEFLELWVWYIPLRALWSPKNQYYWLSDYDAARVFLRGLEDICNRSTGRFGAWWVK